LLAMAQTLAETYDAPLNAAWVREAAEVYQRRGLVKRD
jgi:propanediol dehydratase small subunit